jgi:signal peptidase II
LKKIAPLIIFIVFIDQITKYLIRKSLPPHEVVRILPGLNIVHVSNTGAAFGIFRGAGNLFFVVISIIAVAVILYLLIKERRHFLPYSLILGGAIGNLIDRITIGHVTDFIDLYAGNLHWPAFNVADICLTIGIIMLFIEIFRWRK